MHIHEINEVKGEVQGLTLRSARQIFSWKSINAEKERECAKDRIVI